jgi:two-component system, NarL family, sensor histidine kinase DevS
MAPGSDSGALDESRLRELIDVGRSLVAELDPETIFQQVLEVACDLTGARYAALGVLDENRHELERFIVRGIDAEARRSIGNLPRGRGVLGILIEQPRPLRLSDVGHHPRSYGFPPGHPAMTNFLGVPVMVRGHAWGNLYLTEKEGGDFDVADEQSAMILAEWAAIALENARLYRSVQSRGNEMERAVHRLEATTEIARAIGGETDLDRILEIVVKRGRALVEARSLLILLSAGDELVTASIAGEHTPEVARARIPISGSIPGQVLEEGEPRRVRDLHPSLMARPGGAGVTALLAPLLYRGRALGVLVALDPLGRDAGFSDEDEGVLVSFAASAATAVSTAQSVAEDRSRETITATERERGRWARELHDESLQSLAGLRVLLSAARRSEPGELDDLLVQGIEQVDAAIAEMRRLIADLRPSTLDQLGLGAALETLGERTASAAAIEVQVSIDLDFEAGRSETRLLGEVEDTVYRLVQEALNNAVHHGEARCVWVEVGEAGGSLRVRIADDGKGFDPEASTDGFGLIGMRERAELAGGTLELHSTPSEGTTIVATIPTVYRRHDAA